MSPRRCLIDLSTNCKETVIGFAYLRSNFLKMEKGIRLILALKSHKDLLY